MNHETDEPDSTLGDDEILALVKRLARPLPSGGQVIERAAILAAGADFGKVIDWVIAHDGKPEAVVAAAPSGGLHGGRLQGAAASTTPSRFVLPPGALS
ncbi:MAG: hypothetical protein ABW135_05215 [Thermoleophilaceae bacterium]